ncbi:MAG: cytochrome c [Devosia sp.]|uniref:cytochrome c n=1 Tax=Devosia sp. TaxID=1871048 RepID=UPI001ACE8FC4|nr:cytochrome c [Devosia sp.]MBN9308419.1 cytochrome c [Devosia sp.]MBN9317251.1 cytochrome c [Devosia sp.]
MKLKLVSAWLAAGTVMLSAAVFAHGNATGIVGERMMGMMMLGEQVKLLTPMLSAGGAVDGAALGKAASMIEMHAGPAMTKLFPQGSLDKPSEARPQIWERWQEFSDYAGQLAALGAELRKSAATPAEKPEPAATAAPTAASEWERLDVAVLMGLESRTASTVDEVITGSIQLRPRDPATIFADITATCSSCHASFRR